jgi:hypothetical protein
MICLRDMKVNNTAQMSLSEEGNIAAQPDPSELKMRIY